MQAKCFTLTHMVMLVLLILEEGNALSLSRSRSFCIITEITGGIMEHGEPQPPLDFLFLPNQDSIAVGYHSHSCQRLKIPASGSFL